MTDLQEAKDASIKISDNWVIEILDILYPFGYNTLWITKS